MKHDHVRVTCDAEGCDQAWEGWVPEHENNRSWAPGGWYTHRGSLGHWCPSHRDAACASSERAKLREFGPPQFPPTPPGGVEKPLVFSDELDRYTR